MGSALCTRMPFSPDSYHFWFILDFDPIWFWFVPREEVDDVVIDVKDH
jgi:hypothetical protein